MKNLLIISSALFVFACSNTKQETSTVVIEEPEMVVEKVDSAYVYFKSPADGATVASPVFVEMGVSGMTVEPAGAVKEGFGHHHILINQANWPEGTVIPMSDTTKHYGKGQTDTTLELEAGEYTLSLQFADGVHSSYGDAMATSISITVE